MPRRSTKRQLEADVTRLQQEVVLAFRDGFHAGQLSNLDDFEADVAQAYDQGRSEGYEDGLQEGQAKGERVSGSSHGMTIALLRIHTHLREKGYVLATGEPSAKGYKEPDILEIYHIIIGTLGLHDQS